MHSIPSPLSGVRSPWGGRRAFTLASMYSNGEQGKTFEPWDMTTLYQDRAGTTPVTAVGQVVGYRRDKSGRGNHDVAISDAARGVYGREPKGGTRNILLATDVLATQSKTVTAVAHTLAFTGTGTVTLSGASTAGPLVGTGAGNRVSLTFTPSAGSLTLTVSGSVTLGQLEIGSSATAYQKVTTAYDVTEAGVASCYYVQTDGVNDAYVTPTITPGADKAQIFMGLKKLNDTLSILMELSASAGPNAGTLYAATGPDAGPLWTVNGYSSLSRGSAAAIPLQTAQIVQAAPDYAVIVATHDIAGDLSTIERNGVAGTSGTADKGTGNFLAYPVYVYARGGTTLPAAVRDYGHAFRFGQNLSASTIAQARTLIANNTPTVTL